MKNDEGKLMYNLFPADVMKEIVKVLTFGAGKYTPNNWKQVVTAEPSRYKNALMRHYEAYRLGEKCDPETKLHHLAHMLCCGIFLLWYELNKEEK